MPLYDIKPGVAWNPSAEMARASGIAASIYAALGVPFVITSGTDGTHITGSLHYSGNAMDLRRWDLDAKGKTGLAVSQLESALGSNFDVVLESNHIHVEFDPKTGTTSDTAINGDAYGDASGVFSNLSTPMIVVLLIGAVLLFRR